MHGTYNYVIVKWSPVPSQCLTKAGKSPFVDWLAEPSNLQKALTCRKHHRTKGNLSSYSLLFGSYSRRRRRRRQNMEKGINALYSTARRRMEVRLAI